MKKIIINADDFGLNTSVNKAIIESFEKGFINSTTMMANMPCFEEAVELAHKYRIQDKIGVHLTLTEGQPLTTSLLIKNIYKEIQNSDLRRNKMKFFFLSKKEKEAILNEFDAQVKRIRDAGILITHIDTHHHTHEIFTITRLIFTLLKKHNIPSMRILNNLNQSTNSYKAGYRNLINQFIKIKGLNYSDYFGNQTEAIGKLEQDPDFFKSKCLEIMVHPDYNCKGIVIDKIKGFEVKFEYPEILKRHANLQV